MSDYHTHARIDLDRIVDNLRGVRDAVGDERLILLPVKADAYGHGAVEVARAVIRHQAADRLGVATVPEAVALRRAGIDLPIHRFSPCFVDELPAAVDADVILTVVDERSAVEAAQAAADADRVVTVHLKVETGMGRIGVDPADAATVARVAHESPHLTLEGVYTHLPVSDVHSGRDFTTRQLERFAEVTSAVTSALGARPTLVHAANSGGVLGHPSSWLDMVRPGIMSYGYYPDATTPRSIAVRPALTWAGRVGFVKDVTPGATIGYGRTWTARRATRIATIPIGYADGLSRSLSNRGRVLIHGETHPIVGRICMDQTMVDVGDTPVEVGDEVVLLGHQGDATIEVDDMAAMLGTISYEITCGIGVRVPRIHAEAGLHVHDPASAETATGGEADDPPDPLP